MDITKKMKNSKEVLKFWKDDSRGWAPPNASSKLEEARIDWLIDLTNCLNIWSEKWCENGCRLNDGELILAYANLGALVEGWLKLFYCVYYNDYLAKPKTNTRTGDIVEPNNLKFEALKIFSRNKIWYQGTDWDLWIEKIQQRRNAIHSFNDREIGNADEFMDDLVKFADFTETINDRFPYPDGAML